MSNNYNPEVDADKLIDAKALEAALRRFHTHSVNPATSLLSRDPATGRYDNTSIQAWLNQYADGEIYGIRDFGDNVQKTGKNTGLVLEPSTPSVAGRNDYRYRKLFMCPRCNGGVDPDGMPYVTAIEHVDRFFDPTDDTFVITPVYWRKSTMGDGYTDWEYCDSDLPSMGFAPCEGAYTELNQMRPFILRACYMTSTSGFDSKSGSWPATSGSWNNGTSVVNSASSRLVGFINERIGHGFCGWSFEDWLYMYEMMRLMLGTNSPNTVAKGMIRIDLEHEGLHLTDDQPDDGTFKITETRQSGNQLFCLGETVSITSNGVVDVPVGVVVETLNDGYSAIVSNPKGTDVSQETLSENMAPWVNGSLDNILGTYGSLDKYGPQNGRLDPMTDGRHPFRFQNMEFGNGLTERIYNILLYSSPVPGGSKAHNFIGYYSYTAMNGAMSGSTVDPSKVTYDYDHGSCWIDGLGPSQYATWNGDWGANPIAPMMDLKTLILMRECGTTDLSPSSIEGFSTMIVWNDTSYEVSVLDSRSIMNTVYASPDVPDHVPLDLCAVSPFTAQGTLIGCRASTLGKSIDPR